MNTKKEKSILENKFECLRKILAIKHLDREDEVCV